MKQYAGLFIGTLYLLISFGAYRQGIEGWNAGHSDLAVWWTVIAVLLTIAALGALLGTWIHAWIPSEER